MSVKVIWTRRYFDGPQTDIEHYVCAEATTYRRASNLAARINADGRDDPGVEPTSGIRFIEYGATVTH
jgi:hypothetical protein